MKSARCIMLDGNGHRCPRPAARGMADLHVCRHHDLLQVAIMADRLAPSLRRMLAHARWETLSEGQQLIDRVQRKAA